MRLKYNKVAINTFDKQKKIMGAREEKKEKNSISYMLYFLLVVGVFILLALALRFIFIYQKSTYNTSSFTVLVEAKKPFIVSYDKDMKKLTFLRLKNVNTNKLKESILLRIPIDAKMKTENLTPEKFSSFGTIINQLFTPWKYAYTDMTILDSIKLVSLSLSIPNKDVSFLTLSLGSGGEREGVTGDQIYNTFKDSDLLDERYSIEIINGTTVTGLAGIIGEVLRNAGANIVSIRSSDNVDSSIIITSRRSKTIVRMAHLLGMPVKIDEGFIGVSDIRVILGSDFEKKLE